ncbi:MAG: hypothetical protein ACI3XR_10485 [Eubacteriales bacterium]
MRRTQEEICAEIRRRRDLYREKKRRQKRILMTTLPVVCLAVVMAGGLWKIAAPCILSDHIGESTTAAFDGDCQAVSTMKTALDAPGEALPQPTSDGTDGEVPEPVGPSESGDVSDSDPTGGLEGEEMTFEDLLMQWDCVSKMSLTDYRIGRSETLEGTVCQELLEEVLYPVLIRSTVGEFDPSLCFAELILTLYDGGSLTVSFYEDGGLTLDGEPFQTDAEGMAQIGKLADSVFEQNG